MKKDNLIFWIVTGLFLGFMLFSAIQEVIPTADSKAFLSHLGYADYVNRLLGILKILGIFAILVPGYPRIKEFAYAGFLFDLVGATYSGLATDGFMPQIFFMLVFFLFWGVSYAYFHKRLAYSKMAPKK
jgi:hypothetical protein